MRTFKDWVETQLKRGYSKNQITNYLLNKRYNRSQIERALSTRQTSSDSKAPLILISGLILIVGVVALVYFLNFAQSSDDEARYISEDEFLKE